MYTVFGNSPITLVLFAAERNLLLRIEVATSHPLVSTTSETTGFSRIEPPVLESMLSIDNRNYRVCKFIDRYTVGVDYVMGGRLIG